MTQEHRLILIIQTIRALQIGLPVSKGRMTLLLEPWPDLHPATPWRWRARAGSDPLTSRRRSGSSRPCED